MLQTVSEQQCNTVTEEVCSQQQSQSCTTVPEVEKMTITMMETQDNLTCDRRRSVGRSWWRSATPSTISAARG